VRNSLTSRHNCSRILSSSLIPWEPPALLVPRAVLSRLKLSSIFFTDVNTSLVTTRYLQSQLTHNSVCPQLKTANKPFHHLTFGLMGYIVTEVGTSSSMHQWCIKCTDCCSEADLTLYNWQCSRWGYHIQQNCILQTTLMVCKNPLHYIPSTIISWSKGLQEPGKSKNT